MAIPDRIEIYNMLTAEVVANPNPANSTCNNCATIASVGGSGIFYMIALEGDPPMAGPPSNDVAVICP